MVRAKIIKFTETENMSIAVFERETLERIVGYSGDGNNDSVLLDPASLLAEARAEAQRKVQEAYNEGLRRGTAAGEDNFRKEVGEAARALKDIAEAVRQAHEDFLRNLEPQVVKLASAIAARILQRESQVDRELVLTTVRSALGKMADRAHIRIRANPNDLQVLRNHRNHLLEEFDGIAHLEIIPDDTIRSGGSVVESEKLHVDAQFDAQLDGILNSLMG